jgi:hypothetical protein
MVKNILSKTKHARCVPKYYWLRFTPICLVIVAFLIFNLPLRANATTSISQSYATSDKLSLGSIVSLQKNSSDQVVAANSSNTDGLLGTVVNANNSILALSNDDDDQVQVATNGTLQVLVSDINGTILRGDHITASPISGGGMKATSNVRIIGIAQGDLSNGSQQSYTDKDGTKHSVIIGEVPVLVNVAYYFKEPEKTLVPSALQNIADALAGKTVSTLPIIISSAIFIITLIVVVIIVYAMINSSIISVGRNPMSQSAIYRDIIQLSVLVMVILAVAVIAMYLVLTRM